MHFMDLFFSELIPRISPRSYSIASSSAFLASPYAAYLPSHAPVNAPVSTRDSVSWPPSAFPPVPQALPITLPTTTTTTSTAALSLPATLAEAVLSPALLPAAAAAAGGTGTGAGTEPDISTVYVPVPMAALCVSHVEYATPFRRLKRGLCSSYLSSLFAGPGSEGEGQGHVPQGHEVLQSLSEGARRVWLTVKPGVLGALDNSREMVRFQTATKATANRKSLHQDCLTVLSSFSRSSSPRL
jgi:hypothetical protein